MNPLLVVVPVLLSSAADPSTGGAWQVLANEYIAADVAVLLCVDDTRMKTLVRRRDEAGRLLQQQARPTDTELVTSLRSADPSDRVTAAAVLIARSSASVSVGQALADAYQAEAPFYSRYYVLEAFLRGQPDLAARFARELGLRLAEERSEALQRQALVLLARGDLGIALPVFVRFMETGSPSVQLATYSIVRSLGREATNRFVAALELGRSRDALRALGILGGDLNRESEER